MLPEIGLLPCTLAGQNSPWADGGSGKCCFTLGSFSTLHQAQEAVWSLCFISTPPILTFSFLNEKGFREVGGTGKEVCSLLLLCELSRRKLRVYFGDFSPWHCWKIEVLGGRVLLLSALWEGVLPQGRGEATLKISCSLGLFSSSVCRSSNGCSTMAVSDSTAQSNEIRVERTLVPVNWNVCPYLHCPCPKVSVGSLGRGCFSKFLFLVSGNCDRGFNFCRRGCFCCYMWRGESHVMSWKHKTPIKRDNFFYLKINKCKSHYFGKLNLQFLKSEVNSTAHPWDLNSSKWLPWFNSVPKKVIRPEKKIK